MADNLHSFRVGAFECLAVSDGDLGYGGTAEYFFVNAPPPALARALQARQLKPDNLPVSWISLLIHAEGETILIDTGGGAKFAPGGGRTADNLRSAGISPEEIDLVILTHGHGDHAGGTVDAAGRSIFPKARFLLARAEWEFWCDTPDGERYLKPIQGQMDFLDEGASIREGIRVFASGGHTPGHLALEIESAGERFLYAGDLLVHPIHVDHPDWYGTIDSDPQRTVENRRALLARAAAEKTLVGAAHFPFPGLGHVAEADGEWLWQPIGI